MYIVPNEYIASLKTNMVARNISKEFRLKNRRNKKFCYSENTPK